MKIASVLVSGTFSIFLVIAIVGYVTLELTIEELKNSIAERNLSLARVLMQDLDQLIDKRVGDFKALSKLDDIQTRLISSNVEFESKENIEELLNKREKEFVTIKEKDTLPYAKGMIYNELSQELRDMIKFYKDEYEYDVVGELFLTNAYGANVVLAWGTSDYRQDDEEWWQETKNKGTYVGKLEKRDLSDTDTISVNFRINDSDNRFIGVMRVLLTIDDVLHDLKDDVVVLANRGIEIILVDRQGYIIYDNGVQDLSNPEKLSFYDELNQREGYFELESYENQDGESENNKKDTLVSYSTSEGFGNFKGFGWTMIIRQNQESVLEEYVGLREQILVTSISGMAASIVIGAVLSYSISSPLKQLTRMAKKLSDGDFDVKIKVPSRIKELGVISHTFNDMATGLKKQVQTEKELAETKAKMKNERLAAIGELASGMAHEMRNPLAVIKTSADIIRKNPNMHEELSTKVFPKMDRAISRISHQIEDVLNFIRLTPLNISHTKISSIIKSVMDSIQIPGHIKVNIPQNDVEINCDKKKMEIVIVNLILNSIQAIDIKKEGKNFQGEITIQCKDDKEEDTVIITVSDNGYGIYENTMDMIFEPLFTTKENGTGLGLSTCKNIVEQHGGTITVSNSPTTFSIELPKEALAQDPDTTSAENDNK